MTLSEELSFLLRAERAVRPPNQALERGWERLATHVAAPPMVPPAAAPPLGLPLIGKRTALGFVLGGLGAVSAAHLVGAEAEARRNDTPTTIVPMHREAARAVEPTPPPTPHLLEASRAPNLGRPGSSAPASKAPLATTFDEELRLITAAKRELDAGRSQLAGAWLKEHSQRFPTGVFAMDREALRALLACSEHGSNAGVLREFRERYPTSPLLERLERTCAKGPSKAATPLGGSASFPEMTK